MTNRNQLLNLSNDIDSVTISQAFACNVSECKKIIPSESACLTVLTQNIRSINCNMPGFEVLLQSLCLDTDIIILTECWLLCTNTIPNINGYNSFSTNLNRIQNDGVVVYIKEGLKFNVEEPECKDSNCILIKIGSNETAIIALYRSPSYKNLDPFLLSIDQILHSLTSYKNICLIGDINIAINAGKIDTASEKYLTLMAFHGLLPAHTFITREASGTCLDHVLLKSKSESLTLVPETSLTDHKSVLFCLKQKQTRTFASSTYNKINEKKLSLDIAEIDLSPVYTSSDPNVSMAYLTNTVSELICRNSETVALPRRKKIIKPWITPGLLRCIRNRDS